MKIELYSTIEWNKDTERRKLTNIEQLLQEANAMVVGFV